MRVKRFAGILLLAGALLLPGPIVSAPKAQAIDPVTVALLAPVAVKVYKEAEPRIVRGASSAGKHMLKMGKDVFDVCRLPVGVLQCTLGAPFGGLGSGIKNIGKGIVAPGKLALHAVLLPLTFFGVDF